MNVELDSERGRALALVCQTAEFLIRERGLDPQAVALALLVTGVELIKLEPCNDGALLARQLVKLLGSIESPSSNGMN